MNTYLNKKLNSFYVSIFLLFSAINANALENLTEDAFAKCQFSIHPTHNLTISEKWHGYREDLFCSIEIDHPDNLFLESTAKISIFSNEKISDAAEQLGFKKDLTGKWYYQGNSPFLINPQIIKKSFSQKITDEEILLVGQQLTKGYVSQGGPITSPGIQILRITKNFLVTIDLNFQDTSYEKKVAGYKQLRELITKELIDLVNSLKFEPKATMPLIKIE